MDDDAAARQRSSPLAAGFATVSSPLRPKGLLRAGTDRVVVRLTRVGAQTISVLAESVGIEMLDGRTVQLDVPAVDVFGLEGRFAAAPDSSGTLVLTCPERASGARLLRQAAACRAPDVESLMPPRRETILSATGIQAVLRALVVNKSQARIRGLEADWILHPIEVGLTTIEWEVVREGGTPTSPLLVEVAGYAASYELPILLVRQAPGRLTTTIPPRVQRLHRRKMPRVSAKGSLTVRLIHPAYGFELRCAVVDVSDEGIGICTQFEQDLLCPGLVLDDLAVLEDGIEIVRLVGRVHSVPHQLDKVGISVVAKTETGERAWSRVVRELLHERTRSWGYDPEALWDLYQAAGYLNLSGKSPEDFSALHREFVTATQKLERAPDVGYHVLWPSARGLDAASANLLVYTRSYLGFQMAKRPGRLLGGVAGKEILRDIHWHVFEEAMCSGVADWVISYIQTTTRFSNLLMPEFQARFRDPERESVTPFTALEFELAGYCEEEPHDIALDVASKAEEEQICEVIASMRPRPYVESQDLVVSRLCLAHLKNRWGRANLHRDRVVLVVREHGEAVAAAVAELGQPGLHLFGLLDIVRFFPLREGSQHHERELLTMAARWYRSHDRKRFVYFHELTGEEPPSGVGISNLGGANLCVISIELVPDMLDYLFEQMSWDPRESMPPPPPAMVAAAPAFERPQSVR